MLTSCLESNLHTSQSHFPTDKLFIDNVASNSWALGINPLPSASQATERTGECHC
ncbi:hypothetical protein LEMLEM_LOCUS22405, partial [Lemmus lemmus]